ncbi:DUF1304 domain-containing protein [Dermacoccaceae bacterium W4C1]
MSVVALVVAVLAALLHVFIWYLESFAWTGRARAVFGTSAQEAAATEEMAFNQGFYNLFLAVVTIAGVVAHAVSDSVGSALILAGTGSMLAAALVLAIGSPDKRDAALKQGALPLITVVTLLISLA